MGAARDKESIASEWVYWLGCAATYDPRVAEIARATAKVLKAAGLSVRFLGSEEVCSGDAARRLGEEGLFQQLAIQNIETLQRHKAERIVTHCAHCFQVLKNEYPRFGGTFEVRHHSELIASLVEDKQLEVRQDASTPATLHDSCYVGRYNEIFDAPRSVLHAAYGDAVVEMPRHGPRSFCCGAGGANYWYDVDKKEPAGTLRAKEAASTGARVVVTECPFCIKMLALGAQAAGIDGTVQIKDIAEVVADALVADDGEPGSNSTSPVSTKEDQ